MSRYVLHKKKITPIRRRIDGAVAASWTNAPDSFGDRSRKREGGRPAQRSPPSPHFPEGKRARRLVLCEDSGASPQPEGQPEPASSPTFSGQELRIVDCEERPLDSSPVFGAKWDISPASSIAEEARPSSPVISSFGSSASSASTRLVCVTPDRPSRPPHARQRAPDSGKKTRKFSRDGLAERTARLRKRWMSEAAIWQHSLRDKGSGAQDPNALLLRIQSCSCSFSLLTVRCSVLSGPAPCREARVLLSQALPDRDPRDFPSGAAMRVFPPWQLSHAQNGVVVWNVINFLVEC